ncbi:MAG: single-stranded DNA-binding protein [Verrucomicrobiales bacterium]|nr:single-stranded DNA-binding protein [Verrucomicrobiales bacterium]
MKAHESIEELLKAAARLRDEVDRLEFGPPVAVTCNPLAYAWSIHEAYLRRYGGGRKQVVFVGMNPGPFGMAQTGVPFGEVAAVRDWLGLAGPVTRPPREHPKRPIEGFNCPRSEVSGRRLWGLFATRFANAESFFRDHYVVNYCPLLFVSETGANLTPDKMRETETRPLFASCDHHLQAVVQALNPRWIVGVGGFAADRAAEALSGIADLKIGRVLHPSPASPAANRGWAEAATREMVAAGIWR